MHALRFNTLRAGSALLLAGVVAAGCEAVDSPTGVADPNLAVGDYVADETTINPGVVLVCAFYPDGETFGASTFSASASGGDVFAGDFTITPPPNCFEAWNATEAGMTIVTGSLEDHPDNLVLDRIVTLVGDGPEVTTHEGTTSASVEVSDLVGGNIWFKFKADDTPDDGGGEGCTPGYWRQEHHFDNWTDHAPDDMFADVFADAFPGETLLDVVWARGGGLNALGRSAVAALLNATSPGVDYDYTAGEVVDLFNDAFESGDKGTIENQKDVFDFLNNQGCDLD